MKDREESGEMKKIAIGIGAFVVVAVIAGLMSERAALKAQLEPLEQKQRATVQFSEQFDVPAGQLGNYHLTPAMFPGTISGSWKSSGERSGGFDNAITGFKLLSPRDEVLASSDRGTSGKFVVKVSVPGTYTFVFNNSGLLRATSRRVFLDAEYKPD